MLNRTDKSAVSIDKCIQVVLESENVLTNSLVCTRSVLHLTKELYKNLQYDKSIHITIHKSLIFQLT